MTISLISPAQWRHIRRRAGLPAFAPALKQLAGDVQEFLARPVAVPDLPGGYYHDYFCPEHGVELIFDPLAPDVHRCPVDGALHSGERFDAAWRWFVNNRLAESAFRLALLWQLDGVEGHRAHVVDILRGYAARYAGYSQVPRTIANPGVATYTTLDESVWVIPLTWAYSIVADSLSPAERTEITEQLLIPVAEYLVDHHFGRIHNFACWHNAAIGTIGLVCGREDLVRFAIEGDFGFHTQIKHGVLGDGLWFEGSLSYHFYTLAAVLSLAKATANAPQWDLRQHPAVTAMLRAPVLSAYPDGTLPATNDCWYFIGLIEACCHGVPKAPAFYEVGYAWHQEPLFAQVLARAYGQVPRESLDALLYGVDEIPDDPMPALPSVSLPDSGYAILRAGPGRQGRETAERQYLLLKYGPHGGGHGHPDKLGITLYAHGARLSPDLGSPGYGIGLFTTWYRQTFSHNTVTIDGRSQPPASGRLHCFRGEGDFQIADASVGWQDQGDSPYEGVSMRRILLARPDYFLDLFLVTCPQERQIDWVHHNSGRLRDLAGWPTLAAAPAGDGYAHLSDARGRPGDQDVALDWQGEQAGLSLFVAGVPGAEILAGQTPGNPPDASLDTVICRQRNSSALFRSVFHPYTEGPQLRNVVWQGGDLARDGWTTCTVQIGDRQEHWQIRQQAQITIPSSVQAPAGAQTFDYVLESCP